MKLYEIVSLSRSGHHAMMNWIITNLVGFQIEWKYKMTNIFGTNIFLLDEANHDINLGLKFIEENKQKLGTLIVNYEDSGWDFTIFNEEKKFKGPFSLRSDIDKIDFLGRIIFIRDFYDNLISRLKANDNKMSTVFGTEKSFYFDTAEKYIERWKSLAKACVENKAAYIKYEDWKSNKDVRKKFLKENFNIYELQDNSNIVGTKSSFGTTENSQEKYKMVEIPQNVKDLINKDNELHYYIGKLGYEYRKF